MKQLATEKVRREQLLMDRISLQEQDLENLTTYITRQRTELESVVAKLEVGTPGDSH